MRPPGNRAGQNFDRSPLAPGPQDVATLVGGVGIDVLTISGITDALNMNVSVHGKVLVTVAGATVVDASGFESLQVYGGFAANLNDVLRGIGGNDTLFGGSGNGTIFGGLGNDSIQGGDGADVMTGNGGADRFVFQVLAHSPPTGTVDRIPDFTSGSDVIDLIGIDAASPNGTFINDAFIRIGTAAFGNVAGQLHYVQDVPGNRTLIEGDVHGDGIADFVIQLYGLIAVHATDIVL